MKHNGIKKDALHRSGGLTVKDAGGQIRLASHWLLLVLRIIRRRHT